MLGKIQLMSRSLQRSQRQQKAKFYQEPQTGEQSHSCQATPAQPALLQSKLQDVGTPCNLTGHAQLPKCRATHDMRPMPHPPNVTYIPCCGCLRRLFTSDNTLEVLPGILHILYEYQTTLLHHASELPKNVIVRNTSRGSASTELITGGHRRHHRPDRTMHAAAPQPCPHDEVPCEPTESCSPLLPKQWQNCSLRVPCALPPRRGCSRAALRTAYPLYLPHSPS